MHIEGGKIISQICASDEVGVVVERTSTGLCARIDLPGAVIESALATDEVDFIVDAEHATGMESSSSTSNAEVSVDIGSANLSEATSTASFDSLGEEPSVNRQLNEINAELMKEVERLRAQKEILEQQVAVLSEGSAYI